MAWVVDEGSAYSVVEPVHLPSLALVEAGHWADHLPSVEVENLGMRKNLVEVQMASVVSSACFVRTIFRSKI